MFEDYIASFLQTLKQFWWRNFLLNLKLFVEFKCAGSFLFVSKKNVKKMKMLLMRLLFRWHMRPTPQMPVQAQKSHFVWIVEKSNIFWTKTLFFCWKTKGIFKSKQRCWTINSIMLDISQALLIQKLLFPWNYSVLKSADQFEKF